MSKAKNFLSGFKIVWLIIGIISVYIASNSDDDCRVVKAWRGIGEFSVEKITCENDIDLLNTTLVLYKNNKKISDKAFGYDQNSCLLEFVVNTEHNITVNTCKRTIEEHEPKREKLIQTDIDSMYIFRVKLKSYRKLSKEQVQFFSKNWNTGKPIARFFPSVKEDRYHTFEIKVFQKTEVREFFISPFTVKEVGDWNYTLPIGNSIFDKIWEESIELSQ